MNKSWSNLIIKNKDRKVRSGWIIIAVMATFYILQYYLSMILVEIIRKILVATGDINLKTNYFSEYANWLNDVVIDCISNSNRFTYDYYSYNCMEIYYEKSY